MGVGSCVSQGNMLSSICQVGLEPLESKSGESYLVLKAVQPDMMVDGVKSSCEVSRMRSDGKPCSAAIQICAATAFSMILERKGKLEMGR
ncbi:hypothetical protein WMY93_020086 [Mugilogobius chulae]|uniref:Uncharacterized protein n=1 Tax=Mugilogobius chulae TaxID=88201 RepID=A0AAW0NH69_9GOBI